MVKEIKKIELPPQPLNIDGLDLCLAHYAFRILLEFHRSIGNPQGQPLRLRVHILQEDASPRKSFSGIKLGT
jgi:hypothetical protein